MKLDALIDKLRRRHQPAPPRIRRGGRQLAPVPRYIRRHLHRVHAVDFTVRSAYPGRRERKMQARINRIAVAKGLL